MFSRISHTLHRHSKWDDAQRMSRLCSVPKRGIAAGHDLEDLLLFSISALVLVWPHAVDPVKTGVSGIAHARREFHASMN